MENQMVNSQAQMLDKIRRHAQIFGINRDQMDLISRFSKLIEVDADINLYCSNKVSLGALNSSRFILMFNDNFEIAIREMLAFYSSCSVDAQPVMGLLQMLDKMPIDYIGAGTDLRQDKSASRLKFWISAKLGKEKICSVLRHYGLFRYAKYCAHDDKLLIGIDLRMDGLASVKIYPCFEGVQLKVLSRILPPKFEKVLLLSDEAYLTISDKEKARKQRDMTVHLFPCDDNSSDAMQQLLKCQSLCDIYPRNGIKLDSLGFSREEFIKGDIKAVNLYY